MAALAMYRGARSKVPESVEERLNRLNPGQIECLLLVDRHLSSKEIAARLAISSHTVDQRIRHALQTLGVERRGEAARLVANSKCPRIREIYQRLIHQSPDIDRVVRLDQSEDAVSFQIRHADRAGEDDFLGVITEQSSRFGRTSLPLPFATKDEPSNRMSVSQRLLWIFLIAVGSAFAAGMYLAGLESLTRLMQG